VLWLGIKFCGRSRQEPSRALLLAFLFLPPTNRNVVFAIASYQRSTSAKETAVLERYARVKEDRDPLSTGRVESRGAPSDIQKPACNPAADDNTDLQTLNTQRHESDTLEENVSPNTPEHLSVLGS
jgi:hypothetical protein